jgi:hypothetical protein
MEKCLICERELGTENISKHHLIPKSRGGKHTDTVLIHNICHQKIHSLFTEKELKEEYHTIDKLTAHEEMQKFIKWVSKKSSNFYQRNKRKKRF